ncbi:unnamed protein product [Porites evermanni]|uniref:C2H2-type domain-containing protein n=1 Tax=Porites evermanni TaxID=104178 RepID=A0ABN8MFA2_9CNID|nr:unnamed protein product [Porites evermanni]
MSSEEEATAANVLSQMSQIQQISCETIEATVINVGHHCDVETTAPPQVMEIVQAEVPDEEANEVLQQVQSAVQSIQRPNMVVTNDQVRSQLDTTVVAVLPVAVAPANSATGGRVYPCEYCGKEFNKSYNLKTHIRVHTGERPYQCDQCGHGFANLGDLKRHARTHTGEKPFKCEFCGKVFSDFGSHKRHLRLHTGFKPFTCEQCGRDFTRLDSYKNHIRLHTGDRPYKCDTCEKEFNYLTTYKRHLNIHKGEKPFACEHCDKKFTRLNYLKNHLNTHAKHASQESQTDFKFDDSSAQSQMVLDGQEGLDSMEEETAAQSIQNDNKSEADKAEGDGGTDANKDDENDVPGTARTSETKVPDTSLLQQVTQVLGEIVPHNLSAEVTEGAGGPQIVVQGADQEGSQFKITLAQQLLLAQHLLNQVQTQRNGSGGTDADDGEPDVDQPQITTVTIPEITAELAEQIVNQAAAQQVAGEPTSIQTSAGDILIQSSAGVLHVPEGATAQESGQAGMVIETEVVEDSGGNDHDEVVTEHVLQESTTVPVTSEDGVPLVDSNAVYVAIDPNQPDVQQLLGQIQVMAAASQVQQANEEESHSLGES